MYLIKKGSNNKYVGRWQSFLLGLEYPLTIDNDFGEKTESATKDWQSKNGLTPDGKVGTKSYAVALTQGYAGIKNDHFPKVPEFSYLRNWEREQLFGKFRWVRINSKGSIRILDGWTEKNIVTTEPLHMFKHVPQFPADGRVYIHRSIKTQFELMCYELEYKGFHKDIISWAGSYNPRMVRGSRKTLSNHSWATAFDVNAPENWLGQEPARQGQKGCLYDVVRIANKYGFFWGGHYRNRKDGMHFEASKILSTSLLRSFADKIGVSRKEW